MNSITHYFYQKMFLPEYRAARTVFVMSFILISFMPRESSCFNKANYAEISITFIAEPIGTTEIAAIIDGQEVYLSANDLFNFLRIKSSISRTLDTVSGFLITPKNIFLIDKVENSIHYQGKEIQVPDTDLIHTEANLYLRSDYFGSVFGLECRFDFHSLSVTLTTTLELPAIREMQLELAHEKIGLSDQTEISDTSIARNYSLFHIGMADWLIIANQDATGYNNTRVSLGLGGNIFGGDATANLNYNSDAPFREKEQFYQWKYANNHHQAFRQVMAGKIFPLPIASIYDPIVGVQITNAPTYYRRSYNAYTLTDYTEPNWMVELYVNNTLIDYTKADASGFFSFRVPLVYGTTDVLLRYYGPWGEEKISRKTITVPFSFLPPKELEYKVSAGAVEDGKNSMYSQAKVNYGIARNITVGGGMEYLSTILHPEMPFLNASFRLPSNFILAAEYVYGVKSREFLSYHSSTNFQFEISYTKYKPEQDAVKYNYTQEARAIVSMPFHVGKISSFTRLTLNRSMLPSFNNTNSELLLSGALHNVNMNITTDAYLVNDLDPTFYTDMALSWSLPAGFIFTPRAQYEYNYHRFLTANIGLEKRISGNGYVNASCEINFVSRISTYQIGFRYDLSIGHLGFLATRTKNVTTLTEAASGSIIGDSKTKYLALTGTSNIGRGGIIFSPFLDINGNGIRDEHEPKVTGLSVQVNGGTIKKNKKDSTLIVSGLEPYTYSFVRLNTNDFENIAWRIDNLTLNIDVTPNQLRLIEIPVKVVGEISGMVHFSDEGKQTSSDNIQINFYKDDSILVASTISEQDGYFDFLGLLPGNYTARIDSLQAAQLKLFCSPVNFIVKPSAEGDIIENLELELKKQ